MPVSPTFSGRSTTGRTISEITFRDACRFTLQLAAKHRLHTACPVPVGIIKAVEVEAGLALPADATIKLSKTEDGFIS